jgi:hypothetical protein
MLRSSSRKRKAVDTFVPGLLTVKEQERRKKLSHALIKSNLKRKILLTQAQHTVTQAQPSPLPDCQKVLPPLNPYVIHIPKEGTTKERMITGIKAVMTEVYGHGKEAYKAKLVANMLQNGTL